MGKKIDLFSNDVRKNRSQGGAEEVDISEMDPHSVAEMMVNLGLPAGAMADLQAGWEENPQMQKDMVANARQAIEHDPSITEGDAVEAFIESISSQGQISVSEENMPEDEEITNGQD